MKPATETIEVDTSAASKKASRIVFVYATDHSLLAIVNRKGAICMYGSFFSREGWTAAREEKERIDPSKMSTVTDTLWTCLWRERRVTLTRLSEESCD